MESGTQNTLTHGAHVGPSRAHSHAYTDTTWKTHILELVDIAPLSLKIDGAWPPHTRTQYPEGTTSEMQCTS